MSKLSRFAVFSAALVMTSCTTIATHFPGVYAIDVDQGNIVDQEMIDQLRPDMNKRQVLFILGSPMLIDVFHKERWDYVYSIQPGSGERMQKRISLFFAEDNLTGVQGDFRPSNIPVVMTSKEETVDVPKIERKKTLWEIISGWFSSDETDTPAKITTPDEIAKDAAEESAARNLSNSDNSGDDTVDSDDIQTNTTAEEINTESVAEESLLETNSVENDGSAPVLEIPDETGTEVLDEATTKTLLEKSDPLIIPEQD